MRIDGNTITNIYVKNDNNKLSQITNPLEYLINDFEGKKEEIANGLWNYFTEEYSHIFEEGRAEKKLIRFSYEDNKRLILYYNHNFSDGPREDDIEFIIIDDTYREPKKYYPIVGYWAVT